MTFEEIYTILSRELSSRRMDHTMGVVEEAQRLAELWHAPREKAELAALTHDSTKEFSYEKQLKMLEEAGIIPDEDTRSTPQLYHAHAGALRAAKEFGLPEDICLAIRSHTTGRADMTLLEKILYVADFTDRRRPFAKEITPLRELSYLSLDAACGAEALLTITREGEKGHRLHPATRETAAYYEDALKRTGDIAFWKQLKF